MNLPMTLQNISPPKSLPTLTTLKRLNIRMRQNMLIQVTLLREKPRANLTLMQLLSGMNFLVLLEIREILEAFLAHLTVEVSLVGVGFLVIF
jgi:hypothetical protein